MNDVNDILNFRIYPALFDRLPELFPIFGFKRVSNGYQSTTYAKADGTTGESTGKVYVYENNPGYLKDWTRGPVSIWTYVKQQEGLTGNYDVLKYLADMAGVELPKRELTVKEKEMFRRSEARARIWETANDFFMVSLQTPAADACRTYLETTRGYTSEIIKSMGVGFIPSQASLIQNLKEKGFTVEEINKFISLIQPIGNTHQLTIPYRGPGGYIRGIAARNINHKETDTIGKYLYSSNIGGESLKREVLFNLNAIPYGVELVIVEGLLDALHATVKGVEGVIALGGTSLNDSQIAQLKRKDVNKITLALDNENRGIEATRRAIYKLLNFPFDLYVATLPLGIKDPDQLIKEKGPEAFQACIDQAEWFSTFLLSLLISQHNLSTVKDLDKLIDGAYKIGLLINDHSKRDVYCRNIEDSTGGLISKESFKKQAEYLKDKRDRQKQNELITRKINEVRNLQTEGQTLKALEAYKGGIEEIRKSNVKDLLPPYYSYADFQNEIVSTPLTLKTGYEVLDSIIRIPRGAITIIAARPSHGKTSFMINMMLRMANLYPYKKFYFFSFEEEKKALYAKVLNILLDNADLTTEKNLPNAISNIGVLYQYLKEQRKDFPTIEKAKAKMQRLMAAGHIVIIDGKYTVEDLVIMANHLNESQEIGAIFIDYLQRISTAQKTQDERTKINAVCDEILHGIAIKTGLPVLLGAQMNRSAVSTRGKNRPTLENLKESGAIEEDANLVLSLWQEAREPGTEAAEMNERIVKLEITALKNRGGRTNDPKKLDFDTATLKIY